MKIVLNVIKYAGIGVYHVGKFLQSVGMRMETFAVNKLK